VNDAQAFGLSLSRLGVVLDSQQTILFNAKKHEILDGIELVVREAVPGDIAVIYYSGHGSYVKDEDGDEPDRRDECLVPIDYDTAGMIIDDEISDILQGLSPGVILEIFMDSCFSGSVTRLPKKVRQRFLMPRNPVKTPGKARLLFKAVTTLKKSNHVLWSACRANQVSNEMEFGGIPRGAFTYAFLNILEGNSIKKRNVIVRDTMRSLRDLGLSQVPVLECQKGQNTRCIFT